MSYRRVALLALTAALSIAGARTGAAQEAPPAERAAGVGLPDAGRWSGAPQGIPVALVLGGGGARGLAHAGVLVGMQRLGYDPDLVVGTSMGAIIGALYAAGYDAERIWDLVERRDWIRLFTPQPLQLGPDRAARHPLVQVGFGGDRWTWTEGAIADTRINRLLVRLLFDPAARARGDFDRLPRRFRAVTASLETGRSVVLDRGDLARAVRASMAVPGVFAPVVWNGEVLVDGGIASYLSVEVARELGADDVIAVDVIRPPDTLEALDVVNAAARAFRLILRNTLPDTVSPDFLVLPEIDPGLTEAVFPRDATPRLEAGLAAALRDLPPAPGGEPAGPRRSAAPPDSLVALRVESPDPALAPLVARAFDAAAPAPYSPEAVLDAVDRLYASGLFQGVWPRVAPVARHADGSAGRSGASVDSADAGAAELLVRAEPRPPSLLAGAAGWDRDRGGRVWSALRHRVGAAAPVELTLAGSLTSLERWGSISARVHAAPLVPLAGVAGAHYRRTDVRRFIAGDAVDEREVRRVGGWAGGEWRRIAPDLTGSAVLRAERVEAEAGDSGASVGPRLRLGQPEEALRVVGLPARIEAEARFGAVAYRLAAVGGSLDGELGRLRLALLGDFTVVGGDAPADVLPALGDSHLLPGYEWDEEPGRARAVAGIDAGYPIPLEGWARVRLRAGASPDRTRRVTAVDEWVAGGALELLWTTPFGALVGGVAANTDGQARLVLNVGPAF